MDFRFSNIHYTLKAHINVCLSTHSVRIENVWVTHTYFVLIMIVLYVSIFFLRGVTVLNFSIILHAHLQDLWYPLSHNFIACQMFLLSSEVVHLKIYYLFLCAEFSYHRSTLRGSAQGQNPSIIYSVQEKCHVYTKYRSTINLQWRPLTNSLLRCTHTRTIQSIHADQNFTTTLLFAVKKFSFGPTFGDRTYI